MTTRRPTITVIVYLGLVLVVTALLGVVVGGSAWTPFAGAVALCALIGCAASAIWVAHRLTGGEQ